MAFTPTLTPGRLDHLGHMQVPHDVYLHVTTNPGWSDDIASYEPANRQTYLKSIKYWMDLNGACIIRSASTSKFAAIEDIRQCATILYGRQNVSGSTDPIPDPVSDFTVEIDPVGGKLPLPIEVEVKAGAAHTAQFVEVQFNDGSDNETMPIVAGQTVIFQHTFSVGTGPQKVVNVFAKDDKGQLVGTAIATPVDLIEPPVSDFTLDISPKTGTTPLLVHATLVVGAAHTAAFIEVNFDDGTVIEQAVVAGETKVVDHTYEIGSGTGKTISAQAKHDGEYVGVAQSAIVTLEDPKVSDFTITANPTSGTLPLATVLTLVSGEDHNTSVVEVSWGDGTSIQSIALEPSQTKTVSHTYAVGNSPSKTVSAQAKDNGVAVGDPETLVVTLAEPKISEFSLSVSPTSGTLPLATVATLVAGPNHFAPGVEVNWGDGTAVTVIALKANETKTANHTYALNTGPSKTITAQAKDGTTPIGSAKTQAMLLSDPIPDPVSDFTITTTNNKGTLPFTASTTITIGPNHTAGLGVEVAYGDSTPVDSTTVTTTFTHIFALGTGPTQTVYAQAKKSGIYYGPRKSVVYTLDEPKVADFTFDVSPTTASLPATIVATLVAGSNHTASSVDIDWGDGTSVTNVALATGETKTSSHNYVASAVGTKNVTAQAKDDNGMITGAKQTKTVTLTVPTSNFTLVLSPTTGTLPLLVTATLTASANHNTPGVEVNWGDGTAVTNVDLPAGSTKNVTHTFALGTGPSKTVSAQAKNTDGNVGTARTAVVTLVNPNVDDFTMSVSPTSGTVPVPVVATFIASASHNAPTIDINWGDGTSNSTVTIAAGETKTANHTFAVGTQPSRTISAQAKNGATLVGSPRTQLITLNAPPVVSSTGPGPQTLIAGDTDAGFFGDLTAAELFTVAEIEAIALKPLGGTANASVPGIPKLWIKFIYQNRILYMPKTMLKTSVNWNALYLAGFIYGTNDNGKYPGTNTVTNQLRILTKDNGSGGTWQFKVRLPSVINVDPFSSWVETDATVRNSEFAKLWERTAPSIGIDVVWANYGFLGNTYGGQESWSAALEYNLFGLNNTSAYTRNRSQKITGTNWLPVIELIPSA